MLIRIYICVSVSVGVSIGYVCFLCLMAYQPSKVIPCQSHHCRRPVVVLFKPNLRNNMVHSFLKTISSKVNVIAQLEFELVHYDVAVQHFSHYVTETSTLCAKTENYISISGERLLITSNPEEKILKLARLTVDVYYDKLSSYKTMIGCTVV